MSELAAALEAILFVATEPVKLTALMSATEKPEEDVRGALDELQGQLESTGLGLQSHQDSWQLVTSSAGALAVAAYLQGEAKIELSRAAFETLAMIAYRGPLTRGELDELRGVSSDTMIRNLLQRGLVMEQGKANLPGRPTRYAVSHRFLQHVGLSSLDELPPLDDVEPA